MVEIICASIAAIATIVSAVTGAKVSRKTKQSEARAERRAKESRLAMELMYATCSLAMVTAKKQFDMHTNGDVEAAMKAASEAKENYINFSRDEAARNFAKL